MMWKKSVLHTFGEGHRNISAAPKVPMSSVASIVGKRRKFGTSRSFSGAGRPSKPSGQREEGGDWEPNAAIYKDILDKNFPEYQDWGDASGSSVLGFLHSAIC